MPNVRRRHSISDTHQSAAAVAQAQAKERKLLQQSPETEDIARRISNGMGIKKRSATIRSADAAAQSVAAALGSSSRRAGGTNRM